MLLINGKVFNPEKFESVTETLKIDTNLVRSISVLCLPVLLLVPLLLIILDWKWRHYKEKLTYSNRGYGKYLREILGIPLRKKMKNKEKKHGKNN